MTRRTVRFAFAVMVGLFSAACAEMPSSPAAVDPAGISPRMAPRAIVPGTCTNLASLLSQAAIVFGPGSPNYNSVRGKLENLAKHVADGNVVEGQARAHDIVNFVLAKAAGGGLFGTNAQIAAFASAVYCFSGLDITITDPNNTELIFPGDSEQTVYNADLTVGIKFDAFPVSQPTLITFNKITETYPPGRGPLDTKLDQYPGFIRIDAQDGRSEVVTLTKPATVGVCASGAIPQEVRDRLRLGHGASAGFEITPAAQATFLECANEVASGATGPSFWQNVAKVVLPAKLHARAFKFAGGGVGGTVIEFSPFAPVDAELRSGGGVGGTVIEFARAPLSATLLNTQASSVASCTRESIEAAVGSPVAINCLPLIHVRTRLGTEMLGVPVTWDVVLGGGTITERIYASCGTYSASFSTVTSPSGRSSICWTLGTEGLNRVRATPSVGGDAPAGVTFVPAVELFNATANPAVNLVITQSPASATAGTPFSVTVQEVDKNGSRVYGAANTITLTLNQFTFADGSNTATATSVAGAAVFPALVIRKAASGYSISASSSYLLPPAAVPTSATFTVSPATASVLTIVRGNLQTAPAGTVVAVQPTVRVSDAYDNSVADQSVRWVAALSSMGAVTPEISVSDAAGEASTGWTVGDGDNQLSASLVATPTVSVVFDAVGTSTVKILNQCALGNGGGDPINDPSKPYAFYIPNPGANNSIRSVTLNFSSAGRANSPTAYVIELMTQMATFDPAVSLPVATRTTVLLRGSNSENKSATFTLAQPIVGQGGNLAPKIMMKLRVVDNPDASTISFNTGLCGPGQNCKVPRACNVTEVSNPEPYPLGTFHRKSVGITVKGY